MEYFQPYIRDFLNWLTEQKVSQNTINGYKHVSGQLKPARNGHFLKPKTSHPV